MRVEAEVTYQGSTRVRSDNHPRMRTHEWKRISHTTPLRASFEAAQRGELHRSALAPPGRPRRPRARLHRWTSLCVVCARMNICPVTRTRTTVDACMRVRCPFRRANPRARSFAHRISDAQSDWPTGDGQRAWAWARPGWSPDGRSHSVRDFQRYMLVHHLLVPLLARRVESWVSIAGVVICGLADWWISLYPSHIVKIVKMRPFFLLTQARWMASAVAVVHRGGRLHRVDSAAPLGDEGVRNNHER